MRKFSLEDLRSLAPKFDHFEESEILNRENNLIGWTVNALNTEAAVMGSGLHERKELAQTICLSEVCERALILQCFENSDYSKKFLMEEYPSSCGFAFGFDSLETKKRATCEAIERWAWAQWIDRRKALEELKATAIDLSAIAKHLMSLFKEVRFFHRTFSGMSEGRKFQNYNLLVVLCSDGIGIFPGSRVTVGNDFDWTHSMVEAWRHLIIVKNKQPMQNHDIILKRILFFGKNQSNALSVLATCTEPGFPSPEIKLSVSIQGYPSWYLWRVLCQDYVGWDVGSERRFVY